MNSLSIFDTNPKFLLDILNPIKRGDIQLPDFQRGWVWDDEHIRSLLASIARSFPIGLVMMLETGGEVRFQPRLVEGVTANRTREPGQLILDGQQRLTSLYQSLMLDTPVETLNPKKQKIKRWYYINIERAVNHPDEMEEAIVGLPESKHVKNFRGELEQDFSTRDKEFEASLFPFSMIFNDADWRIAYSTFWNHTEEKMRLYTEFDQTVIQTFKRYQLPTILLKKEATKEAVCLVFEKVNTGGVPLNAFELLTATYAADNFNLRDDWYGNQERSVEGRLKRLHQENVLQGIENTDFLQTLALLHTRSLRQGDISTGKKPDDAAAVSCKRVTILNLPLAAYKQWAEPATVGFERAASFLFDQKIFSSRDIPYQTQLVPLAAILTSLGNRWQDAGITQKIAEWFWCGVLGEIYGSAIETRFARDLPEVLEWFDGGPTAGTIEEANFAPGRLLTLRTRNSAAYKGLHALLMRDGGQDFRTARPIDGATYRGGAIDIHHIFPRAWCDNQNPPIPASRYNSIVNKAAISSETNRIIGGKAPSAYLTQLQNRAKINETKMDELLKSHVIDATLLRSDDFEGFFQARSEELLTRIEGATNKGIAREAVEQEPVEDYPEEEPAG